MIYNKKKQITRRIMRSSIKKGCVLKEKIRAVQKTCSTGSLQLRNNTRVQYTYF